MELMEGEEARGGEDGRFILGLPTFEDIGNGRLRCVETGHELPAKEAEAYGKTKACRLGLIDSALARKKPPLNVFKPDPVSKSKIICKLTGDTINKTEEHMWKHITGKRFLNKLKQKEEEKPVQSTVKNNKKLESMANIPCSKKTQKGNASPRDELKDEAKPNVNDSEETEIVAVKDDSEPDFWMPPVGDRWDFDNGKDRWASSSCSDGANLVELDGESSADLSFQTKRASIAVGPSSFAPRKKKSRKIKMET